MFTIPQFNKKKTEFISRGEVSKKLGFLPLEERIVLSVTTPVISLTHGASEAVGQQISASAEILIPGPVPIEGAPPFTGTITFELFNNSTESGTPLFTDTVTVQEANVAAIEATANSSNYTTTAAGTDYWVATYNGDANYSSVSS